MFYKIAQLILTPAKKNDCITDIFVAQPDTTRERLAGRLFFLVKIEIKDSDHMKLVNFLINELNHQYYQSEKMVLRERLATIKIDHIFESALAKTNKNLEKFVQEEKLRLLPGLISMTVGVIYENELHFTNLGKNRIFLVFKNKKAPEGELAYRSTEITQADKDNAPMGPVSISKLFSSVISGVIPEGGYCLITNENLPEYLSTKQLTTIITTLPPQSAVEQIKLQLEKINSYVPFLALLIKNTVGLKAAEPIRPQISAAAASITNLRQAEVTTEKLLTPSGLVDFKGWFGDLFGHASSSQTNGMLLKDKVFFRKRAYFNWLKSAWQSLRTALLFIISILYSGLRHIVNINNLKSFPDKFQTIVIDGLARLIYWFRRLSHKLKLALLVSMVLLGLFIYNSIHLNQANQIQVQQAQASELVKQIEQKQDQIEADFIYKNEAGAKDLIFEAREMIAKLTDKEKADNQVAVEKINKRQADFLGRIKHLTRYDNPTVVADFKTLATNASPNNLSLLGSKLFAAGGAEGLIYSYNLTSKQTASTALAMPTTLNFPTTGGENIYYFNQADAWQLNGKNNKLAQGQITPLNNPTGIVAANLYNNKLYLVDSIANQVYRYNHTGNNFDSPAPWLKDAVDMKEVKSIFIDGQLYALKANGEVMRFLKGAKTSLAMETVEPKISGATKLLLTSKKSYLYILESNSKRIVVFDNSGKFVKQYQINSAVPVNDFVINESAKKIYWLADNKIFETPADTF